MLSQGRHIARKTRAVIYNTIYIHYNTYTIGKGQVNSEGKWGRTISLESTVIRCKPKFLLCKYQHGQEISREDVLSEGTARQKAMPKQPLSPGMNQPHPRPALNVEPLLVPSARSIFLKSVPAALWLLSSSYWKLAVRRLMSLCGLACRNRATPCALRALKQDTWRGRAPCASPSTRCSCPPRST